GAYRCILGTLFGSVQMNGRVSTLEFLGPAFEAPVQRVVDALLPGLTTRLTNKIRQNGTRGSGQKGYPDYASSPPCDICRKLHPDKACRRVTGACFTYGSTWHMARDCPKNGGNGGKGNGNENQPTAKGRVFSSTKDQAANSLGKDASKLKGCLKASKVHNIEGKMMGKDCKPLLPVCNIKSGVEKVNSSLGTKRVENKQSHFDHVVSNEVESVGLIKNPTYGLEDEGVDMDDTNKSMHSLILESQPSKFKQDMKKELKHPHGWENPDVSAMKLTTPNNPQKQSFANVVNGSNTMRNTPKVNFKAMVNSDKVENSDFVLPIAAVHVVKHKYENSFVGFFVGKKVAFPLVKNYVTNTRAKFLNIWTFLKESGFLLARALVEVSSLTALKESFVVSIPFPNGKGHSLETIEVEYEWQPHVANRKNKNGRSKQDGNAKHVAGVCLTKPKPKLVYREVQKPSNTNIGESSTSNTNYHNRNVDKPTLHSDDGINIISLKNSFKSLMENDKVFDTVEPNPHEKRTDLNESVKDDLEDALDDDNEEVEEVYADKKDLFCSFVYAHNRYLQRRDLWNNLVTHKNYVQNRPWCLLGDFNVSLGASEKSTGSFYIDTGMQDFQDCVEAIEMTDVNIVKRLKMLKKLLRKLLYDHGNLHENVKKIQLELDMVQSALDSNPSNIELLEEKAAYLQAFNKASLLEEKLLM
nr:RNA-directed DNA polymerase, eukaryota, reverse transcriptase zinc-binding domain protein [Tanacetum cinerariifolium]